MDEQHEGEMSAVGGVVDVEEKEEDAATQGQHDDGQMSGGETAQIAAVAVEAIAPVESPGCCVNAECCFVVWMMPSLQFVPLALAIVVCANMSRMAWQELSKKPNFRKKNIPFQLLWKK